MSLRLIQKALVLGLMVTILYMLGAGLDSSYSWTVWCILALALVLEHLSFTMGLAEGMNIYRKLSPKQREDIDRLLEIEDTFK